MPYLLFKSNSTKNAQGGVRPTFKLKKKKNCHDFSSVSLNGNIKKKKY